MHIHTYKSQGKGCMYVCGYIYVWANRMKELWGRARASGGFTRVEWEKRSGNDDDQKRIILFFLYIYVLYADAVCVWGCFFLAPLPDGLRCAPGSLFLVAHFHIILCVRVFVSIGKTRGVYIYIYMYIEGVYIYIYIGMMVVRGKKINYELCCNYPSPLVSSVPGERRDEDDGRRNKVGGAG